MRCWPQLPRSAASFPEGEVDPQSLSGVHKKLFANRNFNILEPAENFWEILVHIVQYCCFHAHVWLWNVLSLFQLCWQDWQETKSHFALWHVHTYIYNLITTIYKYKLLGQPLSGNSLAATLTLRRIWLQVDMKIKLMLLPQSTYCS